MFLRLVRGVDWLNRDFKLGKTKNDEIIDICTMFWEDDEIWHGPGEIIFGGTYRPMDILKSFIIHNPEWFGLGDFVVKPMGRYTNYFQYRKLVNKTYRAEERGHSVVSIKYDKNIKNKKRFHIGDCERVFEIIPLEDIKNKHVLMVRRPKVLIIR